MNTKGRENNGWRTVTSYYNITDLKIENAKLDLREMVLQDFPEGKVKAVMIEEIRARRNELPQNLVEED